MYEITFQFENGAQEVKFSAAPGSTILEAAKAANVAIDAPCNGNGSCGKCRVKLVSGEVTGVQTGHISDEDYAAGWRLSCSTKPAGDITVLVPDIASAYQSRMKTADLSSGEEIAIFNQLQQDVQAAGVDFANDFVQAVLTLDEPTLDDTMPDTERLARFAQDAFDGCTEVRLTYHTVKKLAKTLREANFKVQITGTLTDGVLTIMDVSEKEDAPLYGCAIDIGTTTVTGVLMDLKTGTLTAKASAGNGQIRYGADVINRIVEQGKPGGVKRLQDAILKETLLPLVAAMCKSAGVPVSRVFRVCIASNTTMNHLLLGVDANPVRMEPYIPTFFQWRGMTAKDLGFPANPDAEILLAPNIGSYVGGDITAGAFTSLIWDKDEFSLFIDLGTNGELVFGNRDFMMGERFAREIGATLLRDPAVGVLRGERILLSHGDLWCTFDADYQKVRRRVRSVWWQWIMLRLPLKKRLQVAEDARARSRTRKSVKAAYITDVDERALDEAARNLEAAVVIHGHTHRPGITTTAGGVTRAVLPDWHFEEANCIRGGWIGIEANRPVLHPMK
mgnify:CR=1 FL=1